MALYKVLKEFSGFEMGDTIIIRGSAHYCVVKVGDPRRKTIYRWDLQALNDYRVAQQAIKDDWIRPATEREVKKLLPHFTWRIFRSDVSNELNGHSANKEWAFDKRIESTLNGKKPRLLPAYLCWDCLKEGNPFLPHRIKKHMDGVCHCCGTTKPLHSIHYAWALDLSKYGFDRQVAMGPFNFQMNIKNLEHDFIREDWWEEYLPKTKK